MGSRGYSPCSTRSLPKIMPSYKIPMLQNGTKQMLLLWRWWWWHCVIWGVNPSSSIGVSSACLQHDRSHHTTARAEYQDSVQLVISSLRTFHPPPRPPHTALKQNWFRPVVNWIIKWGTAECRARLGILGISRYSHLQLAPCTLPKSRLPQAHKNSLGAFNVYWVF